MIIVETIIAKFHVVIAIVIAINLYTFSTCFQYKNKKMRGRYSMK